MINVFGSFSYKSLKSIYTSKLFSAEEIYPVLQIVCQIH